MSVPGAYFEVTGAHDELFRICAAIDRNDGRLSADSSASLDLWQEMLEEWFKIHDRLVMNLEPVPSLFPSLKDLYPEVEPFVQTMYTELVANQHKGDQAGWRKMSIREAWGEISWHVGKLVNAIRTDDNILMREHAADIANGAMMFVDILNQKQATFCDKCSGPFTDDWHMQDYGGHWDTCPNRAHAILPEDL